MPRRKLGTGRRVQRESVSGAADVGRRAVRPVLPPRALHDGRAGTRGRPEVGRGGLQLPGARPPRLVSPPLVLVARQEPQVDIGPAVGVHNSRVHRNRGHRDIGNNNEVHKPQVMTVGAIRVAR